MKTEERKISAEGGKLKQWREPVLRKLPVASTAGGGTMNEGVGKGKGNSGNIVVS